jgi:hypothetical protein
MRNVLNEPINHAHTPHVWSRLHYGVPPNAVLLLRAGLASNKCVHVRRPFAKAGTRPALQQGTHHGQPRHSVSDCPDSGRDRCADRSAHPERRAPPRRGPRGQTKRPGVHRRQQRERRSRRQRRSLKAGRRRHRDSGIPTRRDSACRTRCSACRRGCASSRPASCGTWELTPFESLERQQTERAEVHGQFKGGIFPGQRSRSGVNTL